MKSNSKHWDKIFLGAQETTLGWYEADVSPTLHLLDQVPGWNKSTIFFSGIGTSGLVEKLIIRGTTCVLNDISQVALTSIKRKLGNKAKGVKWLCQDVSAPLPSSVPAIDIWIDRAVLHFITDAQGIRQYFDNIKSQLKVGGHVLLAQFSLDGAKKCAGLKVHKYSLDELSESLGDSFEVVSHFDYDYINPHGDPRPYIYVLYKRVK